MMMDEGRRETRTRAVVDRARVERPTSFGVYKRSCAPCAAAKRACDHGNPCSRCQRLGLVDECKPAQDRRLKDSRSSTSPELVSQVITNAGDAVKPGAASLPSEIGPHVQPDETCEAFVGGPRKRTRDEAVATTTLQAPGDPDIGIDAAAADSSPSDGQIQVLLRCSGAVDDRGSSSTELDPSDPLGLSTLLTALKTSRSVVQRPLTMTLEERVVLVLARSCAEDVKILCSIPAVPMMMPMDLLARRADARGRVPAARTGPGRAANGGAPSDAAGLALEWAMLLSFYSRSPTPLLKMFFRPPDEYDITCEQRLQPHLAYANQAWLLMMAVPRFLPADMLPMGGGPPPLDITAAALRLACLLGAIAPASTVLGATAPLSYDVVRDWTDEQVIAAFQDGMVMNPPAAARPRSHIEESVRPAYYRTFAESLILGRQFHRINTQFLLEVPLSLPGGRVVYPPYSATVLDELPRIREVLNAHPLAKHLFFALDGLHPRYLDVEESANIAYDANGVVTSVTLMAHSHSVRLGSARDARAHGRMQPIVAVTPEEAMVLANVGPPSHPAASSHRSHAPLRPVPWLHVTSSGRSESGGAASDFSFQATSSGASSGSAECSGSPDLETCSASSVRPSVPGDDEDAARVLEAPLQAGGLTRGWSMEAVTPPPLATCSPLALPILSPFPHGDDISWCDESPLTMDSVFDDLLRRH